MQIWSSWKRFPDAQSGGTVEAPIGPGVYEVRHTMTGRVVAFGHAKNVASALTELKLNGGVGTFARLFRSRVPHLLRLDPRRSAHDRAAAPRSAPDGLAPPDR